MFAHGHIHEAQRRRQKAFTLIEAVLALAISGVVLAAIGSVFYSALRLRDRSVAAVNSTSKLQPAFAVLKRDLMNAMPPEGILASVFRCGSIDDFSGKSGVGIQCSTTTGPIQYEPGASDVQLVTYMLREPTQRTAANTKELVRTVRRNLLGTVMEIPQEELLLDGVDRFDIECYDGYQWVASWDTSFGQTNLPTAVRINLRLVSPESQRPDAVLVPSEYQLVVPMSIQSRTNDVEAASSATTGETMP